MQRRTWLWLLATALTAGAVYLATRPAPPAAAPPRARVRPTQSSAGEAALKSNPQPRPELPSTPPSPPPAAGFSPPAQALPPVAIQDHVTLDFSSGIVRQSDTAADQAALDAALKEMDEATKNVTFPAAPATPPPPP